MKIFSVALSLVVVAAGITAFSATGKTAARNVTWHLVEKDAEFSFIDNPPQQGNNAPPLAW